MRQPPKKSYTSGWHSADRESERDLDPESERRALPIFHHFVADAKHHGRINKTNTSWQNQ